jgi:hypothetical protein
MPIEDRLELPCWACIASQASDTRVWLANCSDEDFENQRSPGGLPLCCCRIHTVGVVPGETAPAPAARDGRWR